MKTNIGVFFGGRSTEHEISVISANQAMDAIDTAKFDVTPIYITKEGRWFTGDALRDTGRYRDIPGLLKECTEVYMHPEYGDFNLYTHKKSFLGGESEKVVNTLHVAIPVLHGSNGEDGVFQGVLQTTGLPFAGCDVLASANGMDKITMKMILRQSGVPVVDWEWFTDRKWATDRDNVIAQIEKNLGYPVIVKPANLGSSVGISRADDRERLIAAVDNASIYTQRIIVEHLVEDLQEINCSVLGNADEYRMSVLEEPIKSGEILSYMDKYGGGGKGGSKGGAAKGMQASEKRIPQLSKELTERIQYLAGETFRVLGCHGVSRVDVMVDRKDGQVYVNEINTIPGSLSYYLWEATGISFKDLMTRLVNLALERRRVMDHKTVSYKQNIFAMGGGFSGTKGAKGSKR